MRELRSIRRETDERAARYIIEYVCFYNERDRERERKERERRKGMEERGETREFARERIYARG